jgi:DnaK suppressor protein
MTAPMDLALSPGSTFSSLTPAQLRRLQSLLIAALAEQRSQRQQHEAIVDLLAGEEAGAELELARMAFDRANEAIAEAEHALERVEHGDYGVCEICDRPIPFERLEALPAARLCVACLRPGGLLG